MTDYTHNQLSADSAALVKTGQDYFVPNYKPREMILDHGKGARLWDKDGNEYIDLGRGISVNSLGHGNEALRGVLHAQVDKLWHTSNVYFTEPTIRLAKALVEASGFASRVLFSNSGAEANEGAIKLARKHAADKGRPPEAREIITFKGSFHGRTLATVTATAQPKYQHGFEPLPGGFVYCETYNDEGALEKVLSEKTCAILVEPVQGEGGIVPFKKGFLNFLRKKCDERGAILMLDQVQCGMGRTGKLFSHMHEEGLVPDTVSMAKALGCGFPIGALLTAPSVSEVLQFGTHGSTFGGNPMATAVAGEALRQINSPAMMQNVRARHDQLVAALQGFNAKWNIFADIRGLGLMMGAELVEAHHNKAADIVETARQHGVLILVAGPNVLRFLPPLNITEAELAEGLKRLEAALAAYLAA